MDIISIFLWVSQLIICECKNGCLCMSNFNLTRDELLSHGIEHFVVSNLQSLMTTNGFSRRRRCHHRHIYSKIISTICERFKNSMQQFSFLINFSPVFIVLRASF